MLSARSRLEREIADQYHILRSILVLTSSLNSDIKGSIERQVSLLDVLTKKELWAAKEHVDRQIDDLKRHYGIKCPLVEIRKLVDRITKETGNSATSVAGIYKWVLASVFNRYDRVCPSFGNLPPHASIQLDVRNNLEYTGNGRVDFFALEASLFEDMAALWNQAISVSDVGHETPERKMRLKCQCALLRAAAKAAFGVMEAYLSGLAYDILITRDDLTSAQKVDLLEWDEIRNVSKNLSLRSKIVSYTRIAVRAVHPVLDDTRSPEVKRLLEFERELRHALIHPKSTKSDSVCREATHMWIIEQNVGEVCDTICAVVRQISRAVNHIFGSPDWWIFDRESNGRYPDKTFA